jgi:hypothetical protein
MSQIQSKLNDFFLRNPLTYPIVFGLAFLYYLYCICPGIGFGDTAILIDNIQKGIINTEVNTHPLTVLLGKIFLSVPTDNLANQANLMSVFSGSLALAIFFKVVQEYHENFLTSIIATVVLGLSYSFFWHSTIVENYNISSVITALSILFYVRIEKRNEEKWFYPLFALFGIGIFNHVQMGFLGMGIGVQFLIYFVKSKKRMSFFLKCFVGFVIGLIPWTSVLIKDILQVNNFTLVIKNAFMGSFGNIFFSQTLGVAIKEFIILYLFQFPNLFIIFPIAGLVMILKNKERISSFSGILTHFFTNTIFFAFYGTWDKFAFLLQSYILFVFFGSFFLEYFQSKKKMFVIAFNIILFSSVIYGQNFYEIVHASGKDPSGIWYQRYNNNYSANLYDQAQFVIVPNKRNYQEVETYCKLIFDKLPEGSNMLEDDSRTYYPLADYFQKYYKKRMDIHFLLMNSWGIAGWGLTSEQVANEIKMSVEKGIPFFLPTLSSPYNSIVTTILNDSTMYFEKFTLSEKQWIYQVKTRKEITRETTIESGYWDLKLKDVTNTSKTHLLTRQLMYSFDGNWDMSDQIFIAGETGSFLELKLNHTQMEKAFIQINFTSAPDFGILNVYWNNKKILENIDSYTPNVKRFTNVPTEVNLLKGDNFIKVEIVGRNTNSSGFNFGVDSIRIVKK